MEHKLYFSVDIHGELWESQNPPSVNDDGTFTFSYGVYCKRPKQWLKYYLLNDIKKLHTKIIVMNIYEKDIFNRTKS